MANMGACPNVGCKKSLNKVDMKTHLEGLDCEHQLLSCRKCDFKGTLIQAKEHSCFNKPYTEILLKRALQHNEENKSLKEKLEKSNTQLKDIQVELANSSAQNENHVKIID